MENDKTWEPKVISWYEVGRCSSAIDAVAILGKPIAEVMTRDGNREDLEDDLRNCIRESGKEGVKFWVRPAGDKLRYGFYKYDWALQALDFISQNKLGYPHHDWISGLLFGYEPNLIQEFINKNAPKE